MYTKNEGALKEMLFAVAWSTQVLKKVAAFQRHTVRSTSFKLIGRKYLLEKRFYQLRSNVFYQLRTAVTGSLNS